MTDEDTGLLLEVVRRLELELTAANTKIASLEGHRARTSDRARAALTSVSDLDERVSDETRAIIGHVGRLEAEIASLKTAMAAKARAEVFDAKTLHVWLKRWGPIAVTLVGLIAGSVSAIANALHKEHHVEHDLGVGPR